MPISPPRSMGALLAAHNCLLLNDAELHFPILPLSEQVTSTILLRTSAKEVAEMAELSLSEAPLAFLSRKCSVKQRNRL